MDTQTTTGATWRRLLRLAAVADVVVMIVVGLILRDLEALALAGIVLFGVVMLRFRTGLAGIVILAVVLVDTVVFMAPAALSNIANSEDLQDVAIPASLTVISLAGAVAAFLAGFRTRARSSRIAGLIPQAAVGVFVIALVAGVAQGRGEAENAPQAGDVVVDIAGLSFEPARLEVEPGTVSIAVRNPDLFWHTFTIDELGVDVRTPVGAVRRASFEAAEGTYEFVCTPHALAGMKGTLIVRR